MNFITQMSKIVFIVSLILNAILLMYVVGVVPFLLYMSVLVNILLAWYSYQSLIENKNIEDDMEVMFESTEKFSEHLEQIYELEMYYGDENLQYLIEHSRELINQYVSIQEKFYDVEVEDEAGEEDEEEENT
tara:strand:- start:1879 stop:2274 length:396 start_codon:yes stop_codon:yes gene_type:complete